MIYTPDVWQVVKITNGKTNEIIYKVLGGWIGGYAKSDYWKLNSGITKITEDETYFYFTGYTGSDYKCHKEARRFNITTGNIFTLYAKELETLGHKMELYEGKINEIKINQ